MFAFSTLTLMALAAPAAAGWPVLEQGPVSAAIGTARVTAGGWQWDGSAAYLGEHLSVRAQGRTTGVVENWSLKQTCDDDLPPFTSLLRNRGRLDAGWARQRAHYRTELSGVAQGVQSDDEVCTPFQLQQSGTSLEGFELVQDERIFWRFGAGAGVAVFGDDALGRLDIALLRQVDESSHLGVYRAAGTSGSGSVSLSDRVDFEDTLLRSWSLAARSVGKFRFSHGNLLIRPELGAERFRRTWQADSWSRRLETTLAEGGELDQTYAAEWEQTAHWQVSQRVEATVGQARFWGVGLRLWQSLDWTSERPDIQALAFGAGLRYGDDG